nr:phage tail tape measure protein [Oscillospiraceae bacterium]
IEFLSDAAKEMGATTSFTASEAADGLNILAMAGMDMKEAVTASADSASLLETTLNMASAGALSLEDSAGYLTGTLKGFGDEASNAQYYADLMAKGATLANTNVGELGAGLSAVSATARSYGQDAEMMTFSLLKLADANVTGDKAATSLKAAMSNLYTPTDTAKKVLDELGVSAYDEYGKARDLNIVVDELSNALSGLSDQEANAYKNSIFGIQGLDAFNKMANTSADSVEKFKTGLEEASGSTAEQAATQLNNLEGDITLLGSAADGAKMAIYDALNGTDSRLRQFVQQGTKEITNLTAAFESDGIGGVIGRIQEIIPMIGENLVNSISEILPMFLESFNNIILTIVQSISDSLPTAVNSILPAMINGCTSLVSGLVQKIPSFVPTILKGAVTLFKGILDGLNQVIAQITPMLPQIVSDISSTLVENIPALISGAALFFAGIVTAIAEVIPSIITAVTEMIPLICNSIIENIPLLIDAGLQLFVSLTEALPDAIVQIVAALPEIINGIISALLEAVPQIIQAGIDLFVALIGALPEIITTIVDALPQIITGIVTAIAGAIPQLIKAGMDLFLGLIGALPDIIIAIVNALPQITDGIINGLIEAAPQLALAGIDLFIAIISDLPKIIIGIVSAIPKIITGIIDGFKEHFSKMNQIGSDIMAGIGDGIISGVTAVKEKISAAGEKIMNAFKDFFDIHSPSRKLKNEVRLNLADGVGISFTEQMSKISADMQKAVPTHFDLDVEVDAAATRRKRYGASGGNDRGGINFTQINNSPKALDTATINRQTRQGLQLAAVIR